ncbi:3-methyl-2-oxobutanoate hydroxymethyltransferase [Acinetobacter gerneri]|jgi:3-methyl-2-oxobutanoate hydroxymethyltransferase|uniref:3-methyl-2-oxobutanoate hydroxymethyltransferase n=2 Tax=Acinetobacter gerneri TaxID=202952 RepID=N8ZUF4_9GAMM|nr:3-methyl-2-oxobutanoate hydroxymethyltransferase [Acinetobacter gerneri]ENV35388.1 3-methyl-2-oxobutanoate hydroxymethyltransferase [Acinetobacter gerneri DSM 14967 = CIP 107464 = MTCC 9824]EPR84262.1 3-methyl-2-oxobutanoate hydroxymethyltransferase [Acinetobacter gerneri DSM 14967 = CIP 107464 = MTCC 9824]MCH4243933.1 3-methyl-2-oxobutanoate hydroxymethyltransferase [Acinetobacter gerneri]MDQ9010351.1 3-methyl-2-oxobutanoate hydroxymethyltransferase [Acinetobacter gerneri]MDQ9014550.1 3-me
MISLSNLKDFKAKGRKFSCLTCYDASMAKAMEIAEIDTILIGDSLGMAIQGHDSTLPVTVADMAYHAAAVRRANQHAFILCDLPFLSYATVNDALINSRTVMQAGAQMVKVEGGAWLAETVAVLTRNGVPVCVHLGLTPQSVNVFGGYKLQAKTREAADQLIADCKAVVEAGAAILLLECVPAQMGKEIAELFPEVPVIGIGAGVETDGQVLVVQDMLGLTFGRVARFVRNFMKEQSGETAILDAFKAYHAAVQDQSFPAKEHTFQVEL